MSDKEANSIDYTVILREIAAEKFSEIFLASSRKARETYFHRHGIKAVAKRLAKPGAKTEMRVAKLYDCLQKESDDEMAEEILRTWLLGKRHMLAAALDSLGIENDNGLTESEDISKFEKLKKSEIQNLVKKLEPLAPLEDIKLYLRFMGTSKVSQTIK